MFKKQLIISLLVVFFSFGLVGAVFAETTDPSIVGIDVFSFDAQLTPSELSAQKAAMNYEYDQNSLVRGGTEAGNWEYRFDSSTKSNDAVADKDQSKDAICSNC